MPEYMVSGDASNANYASTLVAESPFVKARQAGIDAEVVGSQAARAPHVTLVALADLDRQAVAMAADMAGVCVGTGTACASGSAEPPAILAAIGLPDRLRLGTIRLSLARTTTEADVECALARLTAVLSRLGGRPIR